MQDFFTGWRPKVGFALLVVAIFGMYGWIRSLYRYDSFAFATDWSFQTISSGDGGLWWATNELELKGTGPLLGYRIGWVSEPINDLHTGYLGYWGLIFDMDTRINDWNLLGFHVYEGATDRYFSTGAKTRVAALRIPYWGIVIPSIILAGKFIIRKPQRRIAKLNETGTSQ